MVPIAEAPTISMGTSSPPALAPTENQLKLLAELVLDDSTAIDTVLPDQGSALYRALEFLVSTIDNNKNDFVDKESLSSGMFWRCFIFQPMETDGTPMPTMDGFLFSQFVNGLGCIDSENRCKVDKITLGKKDEKNCRIMRKVSPEFEKRILSCISQLTKINPPA